MMLIGIILISTAFARTLSEAVCASDLRTYDNAVDLLPGTEVLHAGPCYRSVYNVARFGHHVRQSDTNRDVYRSNLRHTPDSMSVPQPVEETVLDNVSKKLTSSSNTGGFGPHKVNSGYNRAVPFYAPGSYQSGPFHPTPYNPRQCGQAGQPPCQPNYNHVPLYQWYFTQLCQICSSLNQPSSSPSQQEIGSAPEN